jgi:hypothetical protein
MLVSSVEIFLVCKWKNSFHYTIVYASVIYFKMSFISKTPEKSVCTLFNSVYSCDGSSVHQSKIKHDYTVQFLLYRKVM